MVVVVEGWEKPGARVKRPGLLFPGQGSPSRAVARSWQYNSRRPARAYLLKGRFGIQEISSLADLLYSGSKHRSKVAMSIISLLRERGDMERGKTKIRHKRHPALDIPTREEYNYDVLYDVNE